MINYLKQFNLRSHTELLRQFFRFGIVGFLAAMVHISIVAYLVQLHHFIPLVANIYAFLISFQASYWGHRFWTFHDSDALHAVAIPKLLIIQIVNFAANEALFFIFLSLKIPYILALVLVLSILPVFTFASSKLWVFRKL